MLTNSLNKTIIISNIIKYLCVFKIGPVRPKRHDETYIYIILALCASLLTRILMSLA